MNEIAPLTLSDEQRRALREDPAYRELYMISHFVLQRQGGGKWYDTGFIIRYNAARDFLARVRPDAVDRFVDAFKPLHTRPDFRITQFEGLFGDEVVAQIRDTVAMLSEEEMEQHERKIFDRDVLHNHAFFSKLQYSLVPLVSEVAGEPVEPGYNFLCLYGGDGHCDVHMDEPVAKWTLDYCIEQSCVWPIHFSRVVGWPDSDAVANFDAATVKADPALEFESYALTPNNALLFAGSGQWHYRDPIPDSGHCRLLFFHYHPVGTKLLSNAANWPDLFDLPELKVLLDFCNSVHSINRHDLISME